MTRPDVAATQRLSRINALLDIALALPLPMREAWLAELPAEDLALNATLRSLLARVEVETDDFLRVPLPLSLPGSDADVPADLPGARVGPYRLVQVLGHGGMATVWLADRVSDDSTGGLQRAVALKLPSSGLGAGMARRMGRERDLLAALEHPRIARLYEAGITPEGRPWLAMERVEGLPLDVFCRRHALGVEARLRLFLQIADAVTHAHARLIVHRDLKPANILVNAQGEVRLLDFGIATLLQGDATPVGHPTRVTGRANTPDYASPEQVAGRPVTVATDVYSLGVVLYEMLTDRRPYSLTHNSLAALEEAILLSEVPRPSANTGGDKRLARRLAGDLDTIVAKALRKPAERRYASVEALAADVQRHLDGEPVLARPPSTRYRLDKLLRRHWRAVAAGSAVLVSMGAGLAVATVQWHEANRHRADALRQLRQAQAALDFSQAVLTEGVSNEESLTRDELLQRSRHFVERGASPVERALAADHLAALYLSYGNYRDAEPVLARALADLPSTTDPALSRQLRCKQSHAWSQLGRRAGAVEQLEAVVAQAGQEPDVASYCLRLLAAIARNDNRAEAALAFATESLRRLDQMHTERPLARAMVRAELAYAHALRGRADLADIEYESALAVHQTQGRGEAITAVALLNNWGIALLNSGRPLMALDRFEQAAAISRRRSPDGQLPPYLQGNLANALRVLGRFEAAAEAFVQTRAAVVQSGGHPAQEIHALVGQALCLLQLGQPDAADALLIAARALANALAEPLSPFAPPAVGLQLAQAQLHKLRGQGAEALVLLDTLIADTAAAGVGNVVPLVAHLNRADTVEQLRGAEAAVPDAETALAIARQMQQGLLHSSLTGQAWLTLGRLRQGAGHDGLAREAYAQALAHLVPTVGADHPQALQAQQGLRALR